MPYSEAHLAHVSIHVEILDFNPAMRSFVSTLGNNSRTGVLGDREFRVGGQVSQ